MTARGSSSIDRRVAPTLLVGCCFLFSFVMWSLATPTMAVPDEPAHAVKAASIWHGQLRGVGVEVDSGNPDIPILISMDRVRVPESYATLGDVPACFAFAPDHAADCGPEAGSSTRSTSTLTSAGRYPPMFYALVGWPSALFGADVGVPLMRLTSAVLCAALIGAGFAALRRLVRADVAFISISVAAVPVLHFLAGSVNPNGVEVAAAIALWCASLAVVTDRLAGRDLDRSLRWIYVLSAVAMVTVRPLSPVFTALVLVWTLLWAGWPAARVILTDRQWWVLNLPVAAAAFLTVGWVVLADGLGTMFGARVPEGAQLAVYLAVQLDDYVAQAIGIFGWLDNGPLTAVVQPWLAAVTALVVVGMLFARRRWSIVVLVGLVVSAVVLPAVVQAPSARSDGVAWQGRYGLPLLVGVPILAVVVARRWFPDHHEASRRLVASVSILVAGALAVAQIDTLQRYVVGNDGPVQFLGADGWAPPIGVPLAVFGAVFASAAFVGVAAVLSAAEASTDTTAPSR